MKPAQFLAHFERISEAPGSISRLRRFILDLAVQGKLVDQDPRDEPASVLLKRIQGKRERLIKEGVIRSHDPLQAMTDGEAPFQIPTNWKWTHFSEIAAIQSNLVNPRNYRDLPHIAPDNIESGTGRLLPYETIGASAVFSSKHFFFTGCILYSKIRPALAKTVIVDFDGLCSADMYPILPLLNREYLHKYMLSDTFVRQSVIEDNRVAMPKINQASLSKIFVSVPPLAEQLRIVAKVDELMTLCDRLEAAQAERESRRDRLAMATLQRLSQPASEDATAVREHARFYLQHLPRLTTRPEQIKELRQTILGLAVRGQLVPQKPSDEPMSALLKRIQTEKARLAGEAGFRANATITPLEAEDAWPSIPSSWAWVPFGAVMISRDGERIPISKEERSGRNKLYDYYGASGVIDKIDGYIFDKPLLLIGEDGANLINRSTPIAFIARGKYWVNNHAHVLDGISEDFLRYVEVYINAIDLKPYVTGTAQPKMNQAKMNSIPLALPPEAEQRRIVAKVDELMALCDRLEAQLTATQTESRRLLEAVLHEALTVA